MTARQRITAIEALLWIILGLTFCIAIRGQEITLTPPGSPLSRGQLVMIPVQGLSSTELAQATAVVTPAGPVLIPAQVGPSTILLFQAGEPGKYTLSIGYGREHVGWRASLDEALAKAAVAVADDPLLVELRKASQSLAAKYPARVGHCVVEVAGVVPFPPDPVPPKPDPVTTGKRGVIILYETADTTPEVERTFRDLRTGTAAKYLTDKGHKLAILDDDLPQAQPWLAKVTPRPGVAIYDLESSAVYFAGELPGTADNLVELVRKWGG